MGDRYAIIAIQTPKYALIRCLMGDIDYDRIGLIINDKVSIYWMIPSSKDPWYGDITDLPVKDSKIFIYNIKSVYNSDKLMNIEHTRTSLENQFETANPDGVNTVNKILEYITGSVVLNLHHVVLSSYKQLGLPRVKNISNVDPSPDINDHADLMLLLLDNPKLLTNIRQETRLNNLQQIFEKYDELVYTILHKDTVSLDLILEAIDDVEELKTQYQVYSKELYKRISYPITDKMLRLDIDGSAMICMEQFKYIISKLADIQDVDPIHIESLLETSNKILRYFNIGEVVVNNTLVPYSKKLIVYDGTLPPLRIQDKVLGKLELPLTGEGLEKYDKEELQLILEAIDVLDCKDDRFDEFRSKISDRILEIR